MKWNIPKNNLGLIDTIFANRGITDKEAFLNPKFSDLSPALSLFGVEKASNYLASAIKEKKKIYIHGDFDVDGITATSIVWNFLYRDVGCDVIPFIPNRFTDGYGLSEDNIKKIIDDGGNVILTVDCGIKDIELVGKFSDQIDFVISDHHTIRSSDEKGVENSKVEGDYLISSKAKAIVHPKLGTDGFEEICGAFVAWKLCCGINEVLGLGIDMSKYLDLVALGTVCDVMPLLSENRIAVSLGLQQMRNSINEGLKALLSVSKVDIKNVEAYHLGYVIGPRLNASGRLGSAMDAVRLLTTQSKEFALDLANKLSNLNLTRQDLTMEYIAIAEKIISNEGLDEKIYFLYGDGWPEGIVGLIAGRLTEKYNRPFIVGSSNEEGLIKASARSIEKFNIAEALKANEKYLTRYGGHAQAAGLSLMKDNFAPFLSVLRSYVQRKLSDEDLVRSLQIEFVANEADLSVENARSLKLLEPFGSANQNPLIALLSFVPAGIKSLGSEQSHIKFYSESGFISSEFIFFNYADKFSELLYSAGKPIDLAGHLSLDTWNGRSKVVFKVKEARFAE